MKKLLLIGFILCLVITIALCNDENETKEESIEINRETGADASAPVVGEADGNVEVRRPNGNVKETHHSRNGRSSA